MEQLGEGGMGVVYVGRHEALGRRVAVKVLRPEMSSKSDMVQRFFNEAQAASAIHHPGIAQVFDVGVTPDGQAYFVMELLEGETLAARLKQRQIDPGECCRIGRQIANVLQAAHAAGITHRDLKPDNLFLVPDADVVGGERVKVLDFGIAKLTGESNPGVQTRTGLVMGTPSYMSPEQCRGIRNADARSDIYSLGCILFKMVCGRAPFVGVGLGEIVAGHLYEAPPVLRDLAPGLPEGLAALIAKMLEKQPDARPQTMTAVSQAFDVVLGTLGESWQHVGTASSAPSPPLPGLPPAQPAARAPTPLPVPTPGPAAPRAPSAPPVARAPSAPPVARAPSAPPVRLSAPTVRPSASLEDLETTAARPLEDLEATAASRVSLEELETAAAPRVPLEELDTTAAPPLDDHDTTQLPGPPTGSPPGRAPTPLPGSSSTPPSAHAPAPPPELSSAPTDRRDTTPMPSSAPIDELTTTPVPKLPSAPPAPAPGAPPAPALPAPASLPYAAPQLSPSSTTISGAAGMFYARPRPGRRRLPFVLGGLVIAGAFVAIAIVLAAGDPDPASPGQAISYDKIATSSATVVGAAGGEGAAPTPPPAPVATDAAADLELVETADDLEAECRGFQVDRKWTELARCADQLASLEPGRAAELKHRAVEELKAAPRIAAVDEALRDKNLRRARDELEKVWPESAEYPNLQQKYELAETQAIARLAAELAQVKDSDCMEYRMFVAKHRRSMPESVLTEATRRTPCTPAAKCDADALARQGHAQHLARQPAASLASYEAAYACKPAPDFAQKAFLNACNLRNLAKAKSHWKRLSRSHSLSLQTQALTICVRNGITEAQLNAP